MSAKKQALRERIQKGDDVHIVIPIAPNVPPRKLRARVVAVLRAGVRVKDVSDGKGERVVTFDRIEPIEREVREHEPVPTIIERPAPRVAIPPPPKPEPERDTIDRVADEVASWVAMGAELLRPLEERLRELGEMERALNAEREAIDHAADEVAAEQLLVNKRLRGVRAVVDAAREASS